MRINCSIQGSDLTKLELVKTENNLSTLPEAIRVCIRRYGEVSPSEMNILTPEVSKTTEDEIVNVDQGIEFKVNAFMAKGASRAQAEKMAEMEYDADGNPIY